MSEVSRANNVVYMNQNMTRTNGVREMEGRRGDRKRQVDEIQENPV